MGNIEECKNCDYEVVIDDVNTYGEHGSIWFSEIGVHDGDDRIPWPDSWPSWISVSFLKKQGCKIINRSATRNPRTKSFKEWSASIGNGTHPTYIPADIQKTLDKVNNPKVDKPMVSLSYKKSKSTEPFIDTGRSFDMENGLESI